MGSVPKGMERAGTVRMPGKRIKKEHGNGQGNRRKMGQSDE
jgi:hypothetical protein